MKNDIVGFMENRPVFAADENGSFGCICGTRHTHGNLTNEPQHRGAHCVDGPLLGEGYFVVSKAAPRFRLIAAQEFLAKPKEPSDCGFEVDECGITVLWGGYEYPIEWKQLSTKKALLEFIIHMAEKTWAGMTARRVANFITAVSRHNRWKDVRQGSI